MYLINLLDTYLQSCLTESYFQVIKFSGGRVSWFLYRKVRDISSEKTERSGRFFRVYMKGNAHVRMS